MLCADSCKVLARLTERVEWIQELEGCDLEPVSVVFPARIERQLPSGESLPEKDARSRDAARQVAQAGLHHDLMRRLRRLDDTAGNEATGCLAVVPVMSCAMGQRLLLNFRELDNALAIALLFFAVIPRISLVKVATKASQSSWWPSTSTS